MNLMKAGLALQGASMKYPAWHNEEQRQEMKNAMTENAIADIQTDADRIEAIIEENSDVIQDLFFQYMGKSKSDLPDGSGTMNRLWLADRFLDLMYNKIELLADEDVEHQI